MPSTRVYPKYVSLSLGMLLLQLTKKSRWASESVTGSTNSSSRRCRSRGSWLRMFWTCIMGVEPLKGCSLTKMWKKIPIAGAPTPSAARNSGKLPVNGRQSGGLRRGICVSRLGKRCRQSHYARSNGPHPKKQHSFCRFQNPSHKSMVRGNWPETEAGPMVKLPGRLLCGKRMASCFVPLGQACG